MKANEQTRKELFECLGWRKKEKLFPHVSLNSELHSSLVSCKPSSRQHAKIKSGKKSRLEHSLTNNKSIFYLNVPFNCGFLEVKQLRQINYLQDAFEKDDESFLNVEYFFCSTTAEAQSTMELRRKLIKVFLFPGLLKDCGSGENIFLSGFLK